MTELRLLLDPALGITAEDFVKQWMADAGTQRQAQARIERPPHAQFDQTMWLAVLSGIASGVARSRGFRGPAAPEFADCVTQILNEFNIAPPPDAG